MSILAILMLVTISFTSAVSIRTADEDDKLGSPLFRVRARRAMEEKMDELKETIKAKFIGEIVWLPFFTYKNDINVRGLLAQKPPVTAGFLTCWC